VSPNAQSRDSHLLIKTRYKIVSDHEIKAAVLIPKDLEPGLHPVIVNIHGGFFSTAHSLFAPFFAPWALKLALDHGAIVVSADYRLLPTSNGIADQLEDLEDFWQWYRNTLPPILQRNNAGWWAALLVDTTPHNLQCLTRTTFRRLRLPTLRWT
jgi:acetyl esterase/lipase